MSDTKIIKGQGYNAQLDFHICKGIGECMKAFPEQAIEKEPERSPPMVINTDGNY